MCAQTSGRSAAAPNRQDIDAYWLDEGPDEDEDFVVQGRTDEHGWVQLEIGASTLCLRPSDLTRLIAGALV